MRKEKSHFRQCLRSNAVCRAKVFPEALAKPERHPNHFAHREFAECPLLLRRQLRDEAQGSAFWLTRLKTRLQGA